MCYIWMLCYDGVDRFNYMFARKRKRGREKEMSGNPLFSHVKLKPVETSGSKTKISEGLVRGYRISWEVFL